jgi:hypothetical protein
MSVNRYSVVHATMIAQTHSWTNLLLILADYLITVQKDHSFRNRTGDTDLGMFPSRTLIFRKYVIIISGYTLSINAVSVIYFGALTLEGCSRLDEN